MADESEAQDGELRLDEMPEWFAVHIRELMAVGFTFEEARYRIVPPGVTVTAADVERQLESSHEKYVGAVAALTREVVIDYCDLLPPARLGEDPHVSAALDLIRLGLSALLGKESADVEALADCSRRIRGLARVEPHLGGQYQRAVQCVTFHLSAYKFEIERRLEDECDARAFWALITGDLAGIEPAFGTLRNDIGGEPIDALPFGETPRDIDAPLTPFGETPRDLLRRAAAGGIGPDSLTAKMAVAAGAWSGSKWWDSAPEEGAPPKFWNNFVRDKVKPAIQNGRG